MIKNNKSPPYEATTQVISEWFITFFVSEMPVSIIE